VLDKLAICKLEQLDELLPQNWVKQNQ